LGCDLKDKFKINFLLHFPQQDYRIFFLPGLNSDIVTVDPKVGFEWIHTLYIGIVLALFGKCVSHFNYGF
jgi:hypothetical protein